MTLLSRACVSPYQYSIETTYLVRFLRYSASKNGVTLKPGIGGCSRSWKMVPFDRSYTTFYLSSVANIVPLCCTIFELFDVE